MAFPLYFDEDSVNRALIRALVARGRDVTNAIDAGHLRVRQTECSFSTLRRTDESCSRYSVGDFFALHTQFRQDGRSHAGLILAVQQRYPVGEQMRRILRMNRERSSDGMRDQVEFLSAWDT